MYLWVLGGFLVCVLAFAIWLGVFTGTPVSEEKFRGGVFFYKDVQDALQKIGGRFKDIKRDGSQVLGDGKGSQFGIYYDDPFNIKRPELFRSCVGLLVDQKSVSAASEKKFAELGYKKKVLPPSLCLHGRFPRKLFLSEIVGAIKFYNTYFKFIARNNDKYTYTHEYGGSLELTEGGYINYYFPTENLQDFHISPYPKPDMVNPNKNIELSGKGKKRS